MRLRELRHILTTVRPALSPRVEGKNSASGQGGSMLHQKRVLVDALDLLAQVPAFAETARQVRAHPALAEAGDSVFILAAEAQPLLEALGSLARRVDEMVTALDLVVPPSSAPPIAVRLPRVDDLDGFSRALKVLHRIFDQPSQRVLGEGVKVAGVDRGSVWIELLADPRTLKFLGTILFAGLSLRKSQLALEQQAATIRLTEEKTRRQAAAAETEEAKRSMYDRFAALADEMTKAYASEHARDVVGKAANEDDRIRVRVMRGDGELESEPVEFTEDAIVEVAKLLAGGGDVRLLEAKNPRGPSRSYSLLEAVNTPNPQPPQIEAVNPPPKKPDDPKS